MTIRSEVGECVVRRSTSMAGELRGNTDIAALSAGVVAVAVSLFVSPGEFGLLNFIVSLTLVAVIYGYVWPHIRTREQSMGVAAACALAVLPTFGFFIEAALSRDWCAFLLGTYDWKCTTDPCNERLEHDSRVPNGALVVCWLITAGTVLGLDRYAHARSQAPTETEAG